MAFLTSRSLFQSFHLLATTNNTFALNYLFIALHMMPLLYQLKDNNNRNITTISVSPSYYQNTFSLNYTSSISCNYEINKMLNQFAAFYIDIQFTEISSWLMFQGRHEMIIVFQKHLVLVEDLPQHFQLGLQTPGKSIINK